MHFDLDEIARQGARKMLAFALQAEVDAYLKAAEDERDECGRALEAVMNLLRIGLLMR